MTLPLWREAEKEAAFRIYLTDAVRLICGNTAKIGGGQVLRRRWADEVFPPRAGEPLSRDAVLETVLRRLGEKAGIRITG